MLIPISRSSVPRGGGRGFRIRLPRQRRGHDERNCHLRNGLVEIFPKTPSAGLISVSPVVEIFGNETHLRTRKPPLTQKHRGTLYITPTHHTPGDQALGCVALPRKRCTLYPTNDSFSTLSIYYFHPPAPSNIRKKFAAVRSAEVRLLPSEESKCRKRVLLLLLLPLTLPSFPPLSNTRRLLVTRKT